MSPLGVWPLQGLGHRPVQRSEWQTDKTRERNREEDQRDCSQVHPGNPKVREYDVRANRSQDDEPVG